DYCCAIGHSSGDYIF
nr:immunoglobulin light chain junction region [Macaca mulatta]MOV70573.1 immunoglobulin light chain junction region [Macaca mulatta]MOX33954.1 immunoglobulin light chain junction region [Macaca mulatta]